MERSHRLAVAIDAPGIVAAVLAGVPAPEGEVDAAGERDRVVDHHHLLMVRRAEPVHAVLDEVDALVRAQTQLHVLEHLPLA